MSNVFVIAATAKDRYNLDGLRKFGEVVYLYDERERKPSVYNPSEFCASLARRLGDRGYDQVNDYLALIGRQVEVGMLFYTVGLLLGDAKIIFFDASRASYSESELRADEIPDFTTS